MSYLIYFKVISYHFTPCHVISSNRILTSNALSYPILSFLFLSSHVISCLYTLRHVILSSNILCYLILSSFFQSNRIPSSRSMSFIPFLRSLSITVSSPELDYVTAYIGCLSSDRADGLYTTVGTDTNIDTNTRTHTDTNTYTITRTSSRCTELHSIFFKST